MAAPIPERINEAPTTFNQSRELFGKNRNELDVGPRRIVRRISDPREPAATPADTGRVQAQMGATVSDRDSQTFYSAAPLAEDRVFFDGGYSLTRAARILHQYDVDFWKATGVVAYLTRSPIPSPSEDEIADKYNDLLAFSYMPGNMLPTADQFRALADPQMRQATVLSALPAAGIRVTGKPDGLVNQADDVTDDEPVAIPPPFAESIQGAQNNYFAHSSGPLYTSRRSGT